MNYLEINKDKLKKYIESYQTINSKDPYIICNQKTVEELIDTEHYFINHADMTFKIGTLEIRDDHKNYDDICFYGCKVLIDNKLKYGDIEVR